MNFSNATAFAFSAKRFTLLFAFSTFVFFTATSQTPDPVCSLIRVSQSSGQPGDTVWLEVRATIPDGSASMQFALQWDADALTFLGLDLANSALNDLHPSYFNLIQPGKHLFTWYDINGVGIDPLNDALLYRVKMLVLPGGPAFIPVKPGGSAGFLYEVVIIDANFKSTRMPENLNWGGVYRSHSLTTSPGITNMCSRVAGCNGGIPFGSVDITIEGGMAPYQFSWTTSQGIPVADTEDLSNLTAGKYYLTVTDQNGLQTFGHAEISSTVGSIYVNGTVTNDQCEQGNGSIALTTSGGIPPYNYSWSSGGNTGPTISGLNAGQYTVTVFDAIGCSRSVYFFVNDISPKLKINETIVQPSCGTNPSPGSIQVETVFGTPPYSYNWSMPGQTTASLENIPSGSYSVTVLDANGCSAVKSIEVTDIQTNDWMVFQQTVCSPVNGPGQILLFVNGGNTMTWPVQAAWSTGSVHTLNGSQNFSVLDTLVSLPDGNYGVTLTDAVGCKKNVEPIVTNCEVQIAFDGQSCFHLRLGQVVAQAGVTVCMPVTTRSFTGITRFSTTIQWDTSLVDFAGLSGAALDYDQFKITPYSSGYVRIEWKGLASASGDGLNLPDESELFHLCFGIKNSAQPGVVPIRFGPDYYGPGVFQIETGEPFHLGIIGFEGAINIGVPAPDRLRLDACVTLPSCATDLRNKLQLSVTNGVPPFSVQWESAGVLYTGTLDDLDNLVPAKNYVTVTDQNGKTGTAIITLFTSYGTSSCVWPGDADDNNAANHYDLLYLGFAFGSADLPRMGMEQGIEWKGALEYFGWNQSTPQRHINFHHMDCDGNGLVDTADLQAIIQNWGKVVRPGFDNPFAAPPIPHDVNSAAFQVFVQPDTISGNAFALPLQVGSADAPADNINGLAFSIFYDTTVIQAATVEFAPQASWLGDPTNELFWVQKNFPDAGRLDIALSRKGISPQNGFGPIGVLLGALQDDMFHQVNNDSESSVFTDTMITTQLKIEHLVAMSSSERGLASAGIETPLVIVREILSKTDEQKGVASIRLYPNPANQSVRIESPDGPILRLTLQNSAGIAVKTLNVAGQPTFRLDTTLLPAGFYCVKIQTDMGEFWRRLVVQH